MKNGAELLDRLIKVSHYKQKLKNELTDQIVSRDTTGLNDDPSLGDLRLISMHSSNDHCEQICTVGDKVLLGHITFPESFSTLFIAIMLSLPPAIAPQSMLLYAKLRPW